ncbi:ERV/ALR sulfhydryl oxidase domain-containing protein [Fimicolochytrium jonesii]|uniref:ERV/ALR sulfhydryl oxidase domain-containing protein n=1 Tax=Fimicolochytrium jonesii TaxID=1396493 RepID=UPI0022FF2A05|nr:ERV/ALR sulfhydryl oxidase domain-containing protein [Fimicolochytrium jonesii]KAI8823000.1 ERV/ALR sulfhydryl oxidase domain-containing protein [Fimicolochytrium jonesii]
MSAAHASASAATGSSPAPPGPPKAKSCGVCTDFKTIRRTKVKKDKSGHLSTSALPTAATAATAAASGPTPALSTPSTSTPPQPHPSTPYTPFPCPPDSTDLGNSSWTFLHTLAAYYPPHPTPAEQLSMRNFVSALSRFYPCGECASHLTREVIRHPPAVESREALSKWMCEVHNEVNERLGKPRFDCAKVDERWRDGSAGSDCFPDLQ